MSAYGACLAFLLGWPGQGGATQVGAVPSDTLVLLVRALGDNDSSGELRVPLRLAHGDQPLRLTDGQEFLVTWWKQDNVGSSRISLAVDGFKPLAFSVDTASILPRVPCEVILVPDTWRISAGPYRGRRIRMVLSDLLGDSESSQSLLPRSLPAGWRLPVHIQASSSDRPALESAINDLAHMLGRRLFDTVAGGDGPVLSFEVVAFEDPMGDRSDRLGLTTVKRVCEPLMANPCQKIRLGPGVVRVTRVASSQLQTAIIQHELLHALGLGHTCRLRSIMALERNKAHTGCRSTEEPGAFSEWTMSLTANDVAAVSLWIELGSRADGSAHIIGLLSMLEAELAERESVSPPWLRDAVAEYDGVDGGAACALGSD